MRLGKDTIERFQRLVDQKVEGQVTLNQQRQSALEVLSSQQTLEREAMSVRRIIAQLEQSLRELPAQRKAIEATTRRDLLGRQFFLNLAMVWNDMAHRSEQAVPSPATAGAGLTQIQQPEP